MVLILCVNIIVFFFSKTFNMAYTILFLYIESKLDIGSSIITISFSEFLAANSSKYNEIKFCSPVDKGSSCLLFPIISVSFNLKIIFLLLSLSSFTSLFKQFSIIFFKSISSSSVNSTFLSNIPLILYINLLIYFLVPIL